MFLGNWLLVFYLLLVDQEIYKLVDVPKFTIYYIYLLYLSETKKKYNNNNNGIKMNK